MNTPSPATLKRYGLYAVLSFFMALCVLILMDDLNVRNKDILHERYRQEQLQQVILDQIRLQDRQKELLKRDSIYSK